MDSVETPKPRAAKVVVLLFGVVAGAAALAYLGITDRAKGMQEIASWTEKQAVPTVRIVQAQRGPQDQDLTLPGTLNAFYTGSLYARASGYVTAWHKDIGARVRKDEILVDISAPDLDQQLLEARATLVQLQAAVQQAQANADLSEATNKRTARLVTQGWSSEERGDTDRFTAASRTAAVAVAKGNLVAQQAVVSRLEELTRFKQIKAPFDGVVTARAVDLGDLLTAGGTSGRPLYRVSDIHRIRVFVNVPQAFLVAMKPGLKASLHVPGQEAAFSAELTSTANAVTEESRQGLVELQADNPDGALWPGAFVEVQFHIPSNPDTLRIPATALLFNRDGTQVAEVQDDHTVALRTVKLGRNLGNDVEIRSGVTLAQRLVDNPLEFLKSGDVVRIAGESAIPHTASAE
ncbi:efflux RND transporter periplasmic adaptor subunit [Methylobacterium sp. J-030]|uniref:efflux RND transporter periplasmic adaptor subunit n=1 Tax=Methylobacterium sp. J-030 TaxID=2836627 RepID=UPI001FBA6332|nr:efflux RND transporter periplasmic adaptor subunit [Methylobacterium sp. J-030]MCJ2069717.1 efflux RND transporter periplasmic adaptor subunit [Methylobacterium sp. J-030]